MNTTQPGKTVSIPSSGDLTATIYRFADVNASGQIANASANGRCVGIRTNYAAAAGDACRITLDGIEMLEAGGSVTAGDSIKSDSTGRGVTASGADVAAGYSKGVALGSASEGGGFPVLLQAGPNVVAASGVETVTSGALSLLKETSYVSVTGPQAFTLADGLYVGQRKFIECTVASTSPAGTLTINDAHTGEPTTWIFNAVGQRLEMVWLSTGWHLTGFRAAGVDAPAAATTLNLLVQLHVITIADTKDWIIPDGEVPGQIQTIKVAAVSGSPVGTISGLFYDEDGSADGIDINMDAAADMATVVWDGARWNPIQLVSCTVST